MAAAAARIDSAIASSSLVVERCTISSPRVARGLEGEKGRRQQSRTVVVEQGNRLVPLSRSRQVPFVIAKNDEVMNAARCSAVGHS